MPKKEKQCKIISAITAKCKEKSTPATREPVTIQGEKLAIYSMITERTRSSGDDSTLHIL